MRMLVEIVHDWCIVGVLIGIEVESCVFIYPKKIQAKDPFIYAAIYLILRWVMYADIQTS